MNSTATSFGNNAGTEFLDANQRKILKEFLEAARLFSERAVDLKETYFLALLDATVVAMVSVYGKGSVEGLRALKSQARTYAEESSRGFFQTEKDDKASLPFRTEWNILKAIVGVDFRTALHNPIEKLIEKAEANKLFPADFPYLGAENIISNAIKRREEYKVQHRFGL
jgi:hypothetical protein